MYKMLHYSRPWECLVDGGSGFYFIINGAERKSKKEQRRIHMSGSCNQSIPLQPRVVYLSEPLILILLQAGLVRFKALRQTCVNSALLLFSKAAEFFYLALVLIMISIRVREHTRINIKLFLLGVVHALICW